MPHRLSNLFINCTSYAVDFQEGIVRYFVIVLQFSICKEIFSLLNLSEKSPCKILYPLISYRQINILAAVYAGSTDADDLALHI